MQDEENIHNNLRGIKRHPLSIKQHQKILLGKKNQSKAGCEGWGGGYLMEIKSVRAELEI